MNKLNIIALSSILLATSTFATVNQSVISECVFDNALFSQDSYSNNDSIDLYRWSDSDKEIKGIFKNGNMFSIKHWACGSYGTLATMFVALDSLENLKSINDDIILLAETALSEYEISLLKSALKDKTLPISENRYQLDITTDEYAEFFTSYEVVNNFIVIQLKLYKN